jgi:hypothetical protein
MCFFEYINIELDLRVSVTLLLNLKSQLIDLSLIFCQLFILDVTACHSHIFLIFYIVTKKKNNHNSFAIVALPPSACGGFQTLDLRVMSGVVYHCATAVGQT